MKADGEPWSVGIQHPRQSRRLSVVGEAGRAVVVYIGRLCNEFQPRFPSNHIIQSADGLFAGCLFQRVRCCRDGNGGRRTIHSGFRARLERGLELIRTTPDADMLCVLKMAAYSIRRASVGRLIHARISPRRHGEELLSRFRSLVSKNLYV